MARTWDTCTKSKMDPNIDTNSHSHTHTHVLNILDQTTTHGHVSAPSDFRRCFCGQGLSRQVSHGFPMRISHQNWKPLPSLPQSGDWMTRWSLGKSCNGSWGSREPIQELGELRRDMVLFQHVEHPLKHNSQMLVDFSVICLTDKFRQLFFGIGVMATANLTDHHRSVAAVSGGHGSEGGHEKGGDVEA